MVASLMTMIVLWAAVLATVLLHVVPPCSAFTSAPFRSASRGGKNAGRFPSFSLPSPHALFGTSTTTCLSATGADDGSDSDLTPIETTDNNTTTLPSVKEEEDVVNSDEGTKEKRFLGRFRGSNKKLTRASLAKLGGSVLLSYGFVSNVFGITCVSCAWYIASRKTGLSPLAPGQWKGFVGVYAAFFAFLNVIRPARFALSVFLSKYFDRILLAIQNRFNCNKGLAVGILVTFNVCFNFAYMFLGIATASALAGVPIWAGRV